MWEALLEECVPLLPGRVNVQGMLNTVKTCREQKRDESAQPVRRPRQCAYLLSETHMCAHTISSQLKKEQAQRLRKANCLLKDEKLGKESVLCKSASE